MGILTNSGDEVGKLLNFDFFFAGFTTGVGMNENRMLISGLGSEFYAHEFIHLIVPNFDRHSLIEEGFATWKGGQGNRTFEECASVLADEVSVNYEVSFADVLDKKWGWEYSAFYTTGAIFFKVAYDRGGVGLVKKLLETPNDSEKLIQAICSVFEVKREEIDSFWRREVLKFKTDF